MAPKLLTPSRMLYKDAHRRTWKTIALDTGEEAWQLLVAWKPKPIVIAKHALHGYGHTVEWHVYAKGGLVGACFDWDEAVSLAEATLTLMEAHHG